MPSLMPCRRSSSCARMRRNGASIPRRLASWDFQPVPSWPHPPRSFGPSMIRKITCPEIRWRPCHRGLISPASFTPARLRLPRRAAETPRRPRPSPATPHRPSSRVPVGATAAMPSGPTNGSPPCSTRVCPTSKCTSTRAVTIPAIASAPMSRRQPVDSRIAGSLPMATGPRGSSSGSATSVFSTSPA